MTPAFDTLIDAIRRIHAEYPPLRDFCAFPDDLTPQPCAPSLQPCAEIMARGPRGEAGIFTALRDGFVAAGPDALWRETYAGTDIGPHFMENFACYCVIGGGGPWSSHRISGYVVYMPPNLWYPWHHHPAEELYLVIEGEAEFLRYGHAPEVLGVGGTSYHASNQPHAMQTYDSPVMAYVTWRNGFETPPVLTPPEMLA